MFKKALTLFTLVIFVASTSRNDLVLAQNQEFKKPTFEEIYRDYSFLNTADLAEVVKYQEEEIKKEFERLKEKEKAEKLEVKTEQRNALASNAKRNGKFRKVEIKVKKMLPDPKGKMQKLTTHHRKGYYAPKD